MIALNSRRLVYLFLAVSLLLCSNFAFASIATHRKGIDIGARGGMNHCIKDDNASCADITPGGGFGLLVGTRFLPYLSVDLDFGFYFFGSELVDASYITDLILELRAYIPLNRVDIFGKFGWGFMAIGAEFDNERVISNSWANLKWGGGATFFFLQNHRLGDMGVGIEVDFLWTNLKNVKYCNGDSCVNVITDDSDVGTGADALQYSVHWLWVFPAFGS